MRQESIVAYLGMVETCDALGLSSGDESSQRQKTLAEHDRQFHNGHYEEGQKCKFREDMAKRDNPDAEITGSEKKDTQTDKEKEDKSLIEEALKPTSVEVRSMPYSGGTRCRPRGESGGEGVRKWDQIADTDKKRENIRRPRIWNEQIGDKVIDFIRNLELNDYMAYSIGFELENMDVSAEPTTPAGYLRKMQEKIADWIADGKVDKGRGLVLADKIHNDGWKIYDQKDETRGKSIFIADMLPRCLDSGIVERLLEGNIDKEYIDAVYDNIGGVSVTPSDSSSYAYCSRSTNKVYMSPPSRGWGFSTSTFFHECGHAVFNGMQEESEVYGGMEFPEALLTDILTTAEREMKQFFADNKSLSMPQDEDDGFYSLSEYFFGGSDNLSHDEMYFCSTFADMLEASGDARFHGHGSEYFGNPPPKDYEQRVKRCHEIVANISSSLMRGTTNDDVLLNAFPEVTKLIKERIYHKKAEETETEEL